VTERPFTTREREDLFLGLASRSEGVSAPEAYQLAVAQGDKVTKEAYQNLARRLVHRGVLVAEDGTHPTKFKLGQSVDGLWLEEEELASMISDEYPILALPIWKESLRQIREVPEQWWILLREKLKGEDACAIFEGAILSYCDDLSALIAIQAEAVANGATPREIAQKREEGRNLVLLLQGLVRFGLGISKEAVSLPENFDFAVRRAQEQRGGHDAVECDVALLRSELKQRVEEGAFVKTAEDAPMESLLVAAVDGSTRSGVMSFLGEDDDFYVGHAPMISINTAIGQVNRRLNIQGEMFPVFTRLPEKPEDMQQRDNKYTVMAKLFFPDLSDAQYMHSLWNAMDVLEARTALRVLGRWYTTPAGVEVRPADVVLRDGSVVPQDRDFSHYKESNRYGEIVRDMIANNWEIVKKCRDDAQTVAGIVKTAQLRVFGPALSWFVSQAAAKRALGPIEAWPLNAINTMPDQIILTRLLTAGRGKSDAWERTALVSRPFHSTTNFGKTYSRTTTPVDQIEQRRKYETEAEAAGAFIENAEFWREFRGPADPFVQMLKQTWYTSCFIATVPRLESERYLPRVEFIVPGDTYNEDANPSKAAHVHMSRVCAALRQTGFDVSAEHSMFRDDSTLEVLPELVARAHDTVKMWARELLNRVDEYLAAIIGRHMQSKRTRGIRVRPFTKDEFKILLQTLERERRRLGGDTPSRQALDD
jgi:hypothetical protein